MDNSKPTQRSIFLSINHNTWPLSSSRLSDLDFVACMLLTYHRFRRIRTTRVSLTTNVDPPLFQHPLSHQHQTLVIVPECDLAPDKNGYAYSRLLTKFTDHRLSPSNHDLYYRPTRPLSLRYINSTRAFTLFKIIRILRPIDIIQLTSRIVLASLLRLNFWRLSLSEKSLTITSFLLFEVNYHYFLHFFSICPHYQSLILSNFYSPSNLGLIKAAKKSGLNVSDLQHGVQKNVAAYEFFDHIPSSLRPDHLVRWFVPESTTSRPNSSCYQNLKHQLLHRHGLNILVSLQPSNSISFLSNLNSPLFTNHNLILRPHPRLNDSHFLIRLADTLTCRYVLDSHTSISASLRTTDLHITEYSSCVLDSISSGVPSVCVHPIALEYFDNLKTHPLIQFFPSFQDFFNYVKIS